MNERAIARQGSVFAVKDAYPATELHCLVIPYRHAEDFFSLTDRERRDSLELAVHLRRLILQEDPSVTGFNLGWNCGESAGQTVMHAHMHLIPRRDGDVANPRGGVRGAVPSKMCYQANEDE
jgi:diadenosine tetraphosphate (Ap4A) HIT family hydrolase